MVHLVLVEHADQLRQRHEVLLVPLLAVVAVLAHHKLKVIRTFFITHNKRFRWHVGDYEKHDFSI